MKNAIQLFSIGALLFASSQSVQSKQPEKSSKQSPEIFLSVYDVSQNPFKNLQTTTMSRSNKNQRLCWLAQGNFYNEVNIIEKFNAPVAQNIYSEYGRVSTSNEGKTNTVRSTIKSLNRGKFLLNCWIFDESDPIGKYSLQVQANKHIFPTLTFSITK